MPDFYKVGRATDLTGRDRRLYRLLEIFPGAMAWITLIVLILGSYFFPVYVAYFLIAFDVYWLLLVIFLIVHLLVSYRRLKIHLKTDWADKCASLPEGINVNRPRNWKELWHLVILPSYKEGLEVIRPSIAGLLDDGYPSEKMIVVLAMEERAGEDAFNRAEIIKREFGHKFGHFLVTFHPGDIVGELKGKGANQAWAAKKVKSEVIDRFGYDYKKIIVSVFDIDTIAIPGYFYCLTYHFLTAKNPYRSSYQPIPVYHNNIWQAPFFSRIAAISNTFWQMMQQVRQEKLATYSSHAMSFYALHEIGYWSTSMVSEDSRIFWHCFCYYRGDYGVIPLYYPVSMDTTSDKSVWQTAKSLYRQQRRWSWGAENIPYLIFNTVKLWTDIPKVDFIKRILVQLHGFHSWATNALIIGVIGWLPLLLGGNNFNITVLSGNLPYITRTLMSIAMFGLVVSAIVSTLLLPPRPKNISKWRRLLSLVEWLILPLSIVIFGSIPSLDAQSRLMFGRYMGFWVTPKIRKSTL
jgi:hypothetical protein